ncbi:MAG: GNAT family N-acetyltransferase [Planctomycetia bacterium]|nr:GNAT family N-acetyltransferase [Planctomycetia bacterium]
MMIRRANENDMAEINGLLHQVLEIHHAGRPDLFKKNTKKYTDAQLKELLQDETRPVFVNVNENGQVTGYVFCVFQQHSNDNIFTDMKTLYIDDLCVDKTARGQHIGKKLYQYVVEFAKKHGCYNITLNVWVCNESAMKFYESCGLTPQKIGMEMIL